MILTSIIAFLDNTDEDEVEDGEPGELTGFKSSLMNHVTRKNLELGLIGTNMELWASRQ